MSKITFIAFLLLVLGAVFLAAPTVRADDDSLSTDDDIDIEVADDSVSGDFDETDVDEEIEIEQQEQVYYVTSSPDVTTQVYFPDFPDKKFVAGEEVTILLGLTNSGDKTFNVSWTVASLHSPFDYSYYIQNFTAKYVNSLLPPHSELTVEYKVRPDISLEPLEFGLTGFLLYNSTDGQPFQSVFFNGTVELTEGNSQLDARTLFTYVLLFAAVGLGAYVFLSVKKPKRSSGARSGAAAASWTANVYKPANKSKAVGAKKTSSSSKKNKAL